MRSMISTATPAAAWPSIMAASAEAGLQLRPGKNGGLKLSVIGEHAVTWMVKLVTVWTRINDPMPQIDHMMISEWT